jgi:hypothetical protein
MKKNFDKKPLFRKEKKTGLSCHYYVERGGQHRHDRHSKKMKQFDGDHLPMNSGKFGYDFTPLYMFLLSKVGQNWDKIYSEACDRLPLEYRERIFDLIQTIEGTIVDDRKQIREVVRGGESAYYSALKVEDGILLKINPEFNPQNVFGCLCHTHSFNGKPLKSPLSFEEMYKKRTNQYSQTSKKDIIV